GLGPVAGRWIAGPGRDLRLARLPSRTARPERVRHTPPLAESVGPPRNDTDWTADPHLGRAAAPGTSRIRARRLAGRGRHGGRFTEYGRCGHVPRPGGPGKGGGLEAGVGPDRSAQDQDFERKVGADSSVDVPRPQLGRRGPCSRGTSADRGTTAGPANPASPE